LITDALIELSIRGDFLKEEADITTKEDIYIYELPDDFKNKLVVKIDDEHRLKYWDFEKYMLYKTGSDRKGCPSHFSWTGGYVEDGQQSKPFMYLYPIPDDNDGDDYTLHLYYTQIHPRVITVDDVDTDACDYILFHEKYEPLLKMLILARWAETKNLDEDAMKYELKFENMLKNYKTIEGNIRQAKYYDFA